MWLWGDWKRKEVGGTNLIYQRTESIFFSNCVKRKKTQWRGELYLRMLQECKVVKLSNTALLKFVTARKAVRLTNLSSIDDMFFQQYIRLLSYEEKNSWNTMKSFLSLGDSLASRYKTKSHLKMKLRDSLALGYQTWIVRGWYSGSRDLKAL